MVRAIENWTCWSDLWLGYALLVEIANKCSKTQLQCLEFQWISVQNLDKVLSKIVTKYPKSRQNVQFSDHDLKNSAFPTI